MTDHEYMRHALSLARKAKGFTSPNPCVGAVVVKDQTIVGKGYHHAAGLPHAEAEAINDAGDQAKNATIYVTLEPCNHFGKTPPCTHKIIDAGIKKVVIGCKDPNPFVSGGGIACLKEHGIDVQSGILEDETKILIEDFIWYIQNDKHPFVTLKCASTLDGQIATSTGDSKWITNENSRAFVHKVRHEADAILIGSGTLHRDNPSLTSRVDGKKTKDPIRVILDTNLTIKEDSKILTQDSTAITIIATGPNASDRKRDVLEKSGVKILEVSLKDQRLDLNELMIKLGQLKIMSLLVEGGGAVAGSFLKQRLVNKVLYFIAPKLLGGDDGIPVFKGNGPKLIKDAFKLNNVHLKQFDDDILIQGYLR